MTRAIRRSAVVTSLLVLQVVAARAQAPTGAVEGFIRDSSGHPLDHAQIVLLSIIGGPFAITDSTGGYRLAGVPAGAVRLYLRRVGYVAETLGVRVVANQTFKADFVMAPAPAVIGAEYVYADPTRGKMGPFNQRRSRGVGAFVTRAEIEKRQPSSISELLRTLPGVHISQRMAGEPQPVQMQRSVSSSLQSTCVVKIYVDGQPYPNGSVDDFAPLSLEGVEVYRSASEIPADFRTRDATCGLISLWTRDPEAARRRP